MCETARRHGVDRAVQADAERRAREASAVAATWRTRWRAEPVPFFEAIPALSVLRDA